MLQTTHYDPAASLQAQAERRFAQADSTESLIDDLMGSTDLFKYGTQHERTDAETVVGKAVDSDVYFDPNDVRTLQHTDQAVSAYRKALSADLSADERFVIESMLANSIKENERVRQALWNSRLLPDLMDTIRRAA